MVEHSLLTESLEYLINELVRSEPKKPSDAVNVLKSAKIKVTDLKDWSDFDHPSKDSYGRKLIHKTDRFEVMAMSWNPGDFSAIHDHGHTQWGAVQIFGNAEHATFRVDDEKISTLARWTVDPGAVIGVHHDLIHQMGCPDSEERFLSLHIYGAPEGHDFITGNARLYDLYNNQIQRTDGGVFFALPKHAVNNIEAGPVADFPTRMRFLVELALRLEQMSEEERSKTGYDFDEILRAINHPDNKALLKEFLSGVCDKNCHSNNSIQWRLLNRELKAVASFQSSHESSHDREDKFHRYNEVYDELICKPSMDSFMKSYWSFFVDRFLKNPKSSSLISLGCGTGLMEEWLMDEIGIQSIFGIDISPSMIEIAKTRIDAEVSDILEMTEAEEQFDIAYSGLNVFQYLDHQRLGEAIENTAKLVKKGGFFIGDFITPDHIRWYPNLMFAQNDSALSLRSPELIEENGRVFQESEIINVHFSDESMEVSNAGKHRRYLPALHRIRGYFESAFGGKVFLFDAVSLDEIPEAADSCKSTRYVVIAQKAK